MILGSNTTQSTDFRLFDARPQYVHGHIHSVLPGKWAPAIVRVLGRDIMRYSIISAALPHITQKVLTETLRKLERNGIITRQIYPTIPPKVEYSLTPLGLDLLKLTSVVSEWIDIHGSDIKRAQKAYERRATL